MADDKKKSKIDLKARLGKTTTVGGINAPAVPLPVPGSNPGGSAPPPSGGGFSSAPPGAGAAPHPPAGGSVRPPPIGIAPPPGISPGIPLPPFATQPRQAPAPAPKPTAAQQTIKVDVGEEVEQERKKSGKRALMAALAGALIGGLIGWVGGGAKAGGDRVKDAARGAGLIEKDVRAADAKMTELTEKLTDASAQLANKQFPDKFASELGAINIPFDTTNLDNRQVGSLPRNTLRNLLVYTSAVENLNKSKDSLKNILGAVQERITKAWKDEKDPVVNFSVLFRNDGPKTIAELVPNKEPFALKGDFPGTYSVTRLENNKPAEKKATRWTKGELVGSDPIAVPVDPKTTAAFTNDALVGQLSKAFRDLREQLEGNKNDPTNEKPGLVKQGDDLAQELHKASLNQ
jgi:hypothetical protein